MKQAFGGVLVNDQGQVLLRRVANDFAGYRWSWAKGTPDTGETPEQTALREVAEETGYQAQSQHSCHERQQVKLLYKINYLETIKHGLEMSAAK